MNKNVKKAEEEMTEPRAQADVVQLDEVNVRISNHPYKIIENYREGFDREKFAERYSDILKKYDYIVGDWGYDQLRLKGFFNKNYSQAKMDQQIENVEDYLLEYCNFGCAYFVLENLKKMPKSKLKKTSNNPNQKNKPSKNNSNSKRNKTKKGVNSSAKKSTNNNAIKKANNSKTKSLKVNNKQQSNNKNTKASNNSSKKRNFNIRKINEEK